MIMSICDKNADSERWMNFIAEYYLVILKAKKLQEYSKYFFQ